MGGAGLSGCALRGRRGGLRRCDEQMRMEMRRMCVPPSPDPSRSFVPQISVSGVIEVVVGAVIKYSNVPSPHWRSDLFYFYE